MRANKAQAIEQKENRLAPVGDYVFKVLSAVDKPAQSGNEMITFKLAIFDENGKKRAITDRCGQWDWSKFQGFCESVGGDFAERFHAEEDIEDHELSGLVGKLRIKHGKNNKSGELEASVAWYIPLRDGEDVPEIPGQVEASAPVPVSDDDVPF